jgi:ABC-type Mn2+/Zn2+ transport system permease subunit
MTQGFLQHALIDGLLTGIGCGIRGAYVYVKRITFLAGGISHTVLGGMGRGAAPMGGALVGAVLAGPRDMDTRPCTLFEDAGQRFVRCP